MSEVEHLRGAIRDVRRLTAAKLIAPLVAQDPDDRVMATVHGLLISAIATDGHGAPLPTDTGRPLPILSEPCGSRRRDVGTS